jgi:hypothetical protein
MKIITSTRTEDPPAWVAMTTQTVLTTEMLMASWVETLSSSAADLGRGTPTGETPMQTNEGLEAIKSWSILYCRMEGKEESKMVEGLHWNLLLEKTVNQTYSAEYSQKLFWQRRDKRRMGTSRSR